MLVTSLVIVSKPAGAQPWLDGPGPPPPLRRWPGAVSGVVLDQVRVQRWLLPFVQE